MIKIQPLSTERFSAPAFATTLATTTAIWGIFALWSFHHYPDGSDIFFGWNTYILMFLTLTLMGSWGVGIIWAGQYRKTKSGKPIITRKMARGIAIGTVAYIGLIAIISVTHIREFDGFAKNIKAGAPVTDMGKNILAAGANTINADAQIKAKVLALASKL